MLNSATTAPVMKATNRPDVSTRVRATAPFLVMDMLREATRLAAAGDDIVHMEAGQPSAPPPRRVIEAAEKALRTDRIGYTESMGLPALRERIARHYDETYGVDVNPANIVITTGSSASFVLAFLAAFDAGDKVALTRPGYPAYRNIFSSLGVDIVDIELAETSRWAPRPDDIAAVAADPKARGILVASPANPTGTMIAPDALFGLARAAREHGLWFISDEIYHGLTYAVDQACALSANPDAIVINSFSKYYCMTGWRIGWMVVPDHLVRACEVLAQSLYISAPTLSQIAAIAAFDASDELEERKQVYAANREFLLAALPGIGIDRFMPVDGAFYVYADVSRFTNDSLAFAHDMLRQAGVAVTPGADFDAERGSAHIRMSFAGSRADMEQAIERLGGWLRHV